MILTKAPFRVSFIGGGSDYPSVFNFGGGAVLSCTLDLHVYTAILPLAQNAPEKVRFTYHKSESVNHIASLEHPTVREALLKYDWTSPINIATFAEVPARTGLGGSSSFLVSLLLALSEMKGELITPKQLAMSAIDIERNRCAEQGGWQDQFSAAFGGMRLYKFEDNNVEVSENIISNNLLDEISKSCFLTPLEMIRERDHAALTEEKLTSIHESKVAAIAGGKRAIEVGNYLNSNLSPQEMVSILGETVNYSQDLKNAFSENHNQIDFVIEKAQKSGATGSKIVGAGGGGYVLSIVPESNIEKFRIKMFDLGTFSPGFSIIGASKAKIKW